MTMNKTTSFSLLSDDGAIGWNELSPLAISPDAAMLNVSLNIEAELPGHIIVHAEVTNRGTAPALLESIRWTHAGRSKHTLKFPAAMSPLLYCSENFRSDYFGTGTVVGSSYGLPLTNATLEVGWTEDQCFPGLFIASKEEPKGLFCAALTHECFHPIFRLRGRSLEVGDWFFEIEETPASCGGLVLQPGQTIRGESFLLAFRATNRPQEAGALYEEELTARGVYTRRETLNPLPEQRIWCSWNYDFFENVTEDDLLRQAPVLKEYFPNVRFIQLDDGYQREYAPGSRAMIDLVYDGKEPFDPVKFPSGAKGTADRIRAAGFRPAIWLGLWASAKSTLVADHPEWLLTDDAGRPLLFDQWYGGVHVLDASLPEVREYLERVCATVFGEWGYEGVKLDFSTFAFEGKRNRLRGGISGLQAKREVLKIFRRHLPADGFFGWCVVTGTGNPLAGMEADYFRNAEDIGKGNWDLAQRIAKWTTNTNLFIQRWPVLPNIDSVGWGPQFDEAAWLTWLNICAVSGMAMEVSGDLPKLPQERLRLLSRVMELSDPARRLTMRDIPSGEFDHPPSIWWASGERETLVAHFNWTDEPIHLKPQIPSERPGGIRWNDAWTGDPVNSETMLLLPPRSSVLWIGQ